MSNSINTARLPYVAFFAGVFSLVVLATASNALGVMIFAAPDRNTDAPSAAEGLDGWNLQAAWGNYLATPISPTHFIASKHISPVPLETLSFQGQVYTVDTLSRIEDPDSDLVIYSIVGDTFSNYATLYDAAVDGSEIGKTLTVIGRGTRRGADVYAGDHLAGWRWGSSDHVQSWGQNIVADFATFNSSSPDSFLYFTFDADGIANEAALSTGDSSGGVFIFSDGIWKLAGISYAVDGPFSLTGDSEDAGFSAAIFDARGLYYKIDGEWTLIEHDEALPAGSYASRISSRLNWINSVVPEPGAVALLISGGAILAMFSFFVRRRQGAK